MYSRLEIDVAKGGFELATTKILPINLLIDGLILYYLFIISVVYSFYLLIDFIN